MRVQIKSIFEQIAEQVFKMNNTEAAKQFISDFVNNKDINEKDKKAILKAIDEAKSITRIHTYIANSLLKYEGMGINQLEKTAREAAAETEFE
jgi:hypothetical protein